MRHKNNKKHGLSKIERLSNKKDISCLYDNGKKIFEPPLMATYVFVPYREDVRVLFAIPKKFFKKAVERNYYKRVLRETYRLNKETLTILTHQKKTGIDIALTVIANQCLNFKQIRAKTILLINSIRNVLYEMD